MLNAPARLRHSPVEEHRLAEPAAHKVAATAFKQFCKSVTELPSVEIRGDDTVKRHFHIQNHRLGGSCGSVRVLGCVELQLRRRVCHRADAVHVSVELGLALLRGGESRSTETRGH